MQLQEAPHLHVQMQVGYFWLIVLSSGRVGSDVMLGECDSRFAGRLQLVLSLTFSISLTAELL